MMTNSWTRHRAFGVAAATVTLAMLAACGDSGDRDVDADADGGGDGASTTTAEPVAPADVESSTTTTAPQPTVPSATTEDAGVVDETVHEVVDAEIIATIALDRDDLGFLSSDGEALWATGHDGVVVRVDPDTGDVTELSVGDGQISGPLLPTVVDESIWFSAIQDSHIVRLDRTTLAAGPPIEVPGVPGLVIAGPGDQLWIESTESPAGLWPVDAVAGVAGEVVTIAETDEIVGSAAAFGALWVPLYDGGELVKLDAAGTELERLPTGVGPLYVREALGWLWHANSIDGTIARVDPETLTVKVVDLNSGGPTIEQPSAVVSTGDAVWARAARLDDGQAIVFRIDPVTGSVAGRRTLPDRRRLDQIGGMAVLDDRLFVLDRPGRVLLELNTDQFLSGGGPPATTVVDDPAATQVAESIRILLATATTPEQMADGIVDGDRLADQIEAFKQFFVDNLPGEEYEGAAPSVRIDGDVAEIEFYVVVAGEPIVEVIQGSAIRQEGRWMLSGESFCRLVATGGIPCPTDLGGSG